MSIPAKFLTVQEVAKLVGVSAAAVYARLGLMRSEEYFGRRVIPRAEAEKYRREHLARLRTQLEKAK